MRIWALLFQVNSLTFNSVVVAAAGKSFESSVAAVPASAASQASSSLHLCTVAGFASADLSAFDAELLYFLALLELFFDSFGSFELLHAFDGQCQVGDLDGCGSFLFVVVA